MAEYRHHDFRFRLVCGQFNTEKGTMMSILRPQYLGVILVFVYSLATYSEACSCLHGDALTTFCQHPYVFVARVEEELASFTPEWVRNYTYADVFTYRRYRAYLPAILRASGSLLTVSTVTIQDDPVCRYLLTVGSLYFLAVEPVQDKLANNTEVFGINLCSLNYEFGSTNNTWDFSTIRDFIENEPTCDTPGVGRPVVQPSDGFYK